MSIKDASEKKMLEDIHILSKLENELGNSKDNEKSCENIEKLSDEAKKLHKAGNLDEAIAKYEHAIKICTNFVKHGQKETDDYIKLKLLLRIELKPQFTKVLIDRAKILESTNNQELALEDIVTACLLEKYSNEATLQIADKILKKLCREKASEYLTKRKLIMPSKNFITAYFLSFSDHPILSKMDKELRIETNTPYNNAIKALQNKEYDDIIPFCTEELEVIPSDENSIHKMEVFLLRGTFYLLIGQYKDALEDLTTVIDNNVSSIKLKVNAFIMRASLNIQLDNTEESFADFAEAEKLNPTCSDIFHNRGQVYLLMEKIAEAKSDFEKAERCNPQFDIACIQKYYTNYRYAVMKNNDDMINEALIQFDEGIKKFPECSEGYSLYAQVLADCEDFEKSNIYFIKSCERDPHNPNTYVHRGLLQLKWCNNISKAMEYIWKAIAVDEKCEFAYETLGTIEVQRGNLKDAISLFEKALTFGRNIVEFVHIFSLLDVAKTQLKVSNKLKTDVISILQKL